MGDRNCTIIIARAPHPPHLSRLVMYRDPTGSIRAKLDLLNKLLMPHQ